MGQAKRKRVTKEALAKKLATSMNDEEVKQLLRLAGLVADVFSEKSRQPENRRELYPREAAALLCECKHIAVVGLWDDDVHRRVLQVLIGQYGTDFPFTVVRNIYAPSERPHISVVDVNTSPVLPADTERAYPDVFIGFLADTPKHRAHITAVLTITALQLDAEIPRIQLEDVDVVAPVVGLSGDPEFQETVALMYNTLQQIYRGEADDRSLN